MRAFAIRPFIPAVVALLAIGGLELSGQRYVSELSAQRGGRSAPIVAGMLPDDLAYNFYFARAIYSGGGGGWGRGSGWSTDWPDADRWITNVLRRLTGVDVFPREYAVALDDPELRPDRWTVRTALDRVREVGDPLGPLVGLAQDLPPL